MINERWQRKKRSRAEIEAIAKAILGEMTLDQKINQMAGDYYEPEKELKRMMEEGYNLTPYCAGGDEALGIPPIAFTDGPRGVVMDHATCFPVSMARAASWDVELEERIANVIGIEARALDANFFGGVCINLPRHPAWGRAQETFGEDPHMLGEFGAAQVRGVQKHNVIACIKHFAGNSMENARFKVNVKMDERTLREVYTPHFRRCIQEGAAAVMSAYNRFRGEHCGHNAYLLRQVLKGDWQFDGIVITDFVFGMYDGKKAIEGGVDIEMPFTMHYGDKLKALVERGQVSETLIDEAVLRILVQKLRFFTAEDKQDYTREMVACKAHVDLARESAEKSMVLLKNEGGILPLQADKIKRLAVVGILGDTPNTGDRGSSMVRNEHTVTPLEGIKTLVGDKVEVVYSDGKDLQQVSDLAKSADVVIVVTGNRTGDEGEYMEAFSGEMNGGDRDSLSIVEEELLMLTTAVQANKDCIVVLEGGSTIMMEEWKNRVPAILMMWYAGMEGGHALANILFGKVNPSGKLPLTIPSDAHQLPYFNKNAEEIEYGYYHGYTLFDKKGYVPAFPFGFGLSYTKFQFDAVKVQVQDGQLVATVDVTNIGKMAGEEVVQLYVGFENSAIDRPVKSLKGFKKVAIEPGQTRTVQINVDIEDLAYYDVQNECWKVESMDYTIYVGSSSKTEDLLVAKVHL